MLMKNRIGILTLAMAVLMGCLAVFTSAGVAPQATDWDNFEINDGVSLGVVERLDGGAYGLDLSTYSIVGLKQATYMLIWTQEPLDEAGQEAARAAVRSNDNSNWNNVSIYSGVGVWTKPSFAGNNFGQYEVRVVDGTWYLYVGSNQQVSHFVLGTGESKSTTTTTEPTTTTNEEIIDDDDPPLAGPTTVPEEIIEEDDIPLAKTPAAASPQTGTVWPAAAGITAMAAAVCLVMFKRPRKEQ